MKYHLIGMNIITDSNINQIISFEKDFSSIKQGYDLLVSLNEIKIDNEFFRI